jgi:hypothetical protein
MVERYRPQPLTINEASERHPNEWILMRVTARDEYDVPTLGLIVAAAKKRNDIQPAVLDAVAGAGQTGEEYYVFRGYKRLQPGPETQLALDKMIYRGTRRDQRGR